MYLFSGYRWKFCSNYWKRNGVSRLAKMFWGMDPPTNPNEIPENYKEVYSQKRAKKTIRFCKFLSKIGLDETANNVKNDPSLYVEEDFNGKKTWIEYVNRLLGFLAGNLMLLGFLDAF